MNIESIVNDFYISRIIYIIILILLNIDVIAYLKRKNIYLKDKLNYKNINLEFLLNMIFLSLFLRIIVELILPIFLQNETSITISINIGQVIAEFITTCIFAPILEEIMFRFGLFGILHKKMNYILSIIITSIIFALVHPYGLDGLVILIIISIVWNYSYYKTNNLIYPIILHFIHNLYAMLGNQLNNQIYYIIIFITCFIGYIITLKKQKN